MNEKDFSTQIEASKQLALTIKQCFEFLYSLCLRLEDEIMFLARKCLQISDTVIVLDAVQVMNHPAIRQGLAIRFFPYDDVLKDVAVTGTQVIGFVQQDISIAMAYPAPYPRRMARAFACFPCAGITPEPSV